MVISAEKVAALGKRMDDLGIRPEELVEKFVTGSGKGGQKINKSSTAVYLKHVSSGLEVKCQKSRSQADNRFFARRELCDKLERQLLGSKSKEEQAHEKIRQQKKRRARRHKKSAPM